MESKVNIEGVAKILAEGLILQWDDMVTSLGGGSISFTGWKAVPNSVDHAAQIVWFPPIESRNDPRAEEDFNFYMVQLPSGDVNKMPMSGHGAITLQNDGPVVTYLTTKSEIREMFTSGLKSLIAKVIEDSPWWLEDAIKEGDQLWNRRKE